MTPRKWMRKQKALAFENGCVWGAAIVAMGQAIQDAEPRWRSYTNVCMVCKDPIDPSAPKCRCFPEGWPVEKSGDDRSPTPKDER